MARIFVATECHCSSFSELANILSSLHRRMPHSVSSHPPMPLALEHGCKLFDHFRTSNTPTRRRRTETERPCGVQLESGVAPIVRNRVFVGNAPGGG